MLTLIEATLALSDARWKAGAPNTNTNSEHLHIAHQRGELQAQLKAIKAASVPAATATRGGASLLDRLGADGIKKWQTAVDGKRLTLTVELTNPQGIDAFLAALD
jgi:hypothetical protein